MKSFLLKIFSKTLIFILLLGVIEFFVFPKNVNVMSIKESLLREEAIEVLVLGNSHTFFGLNPDFFSKKTVNIANKGRKLETDFLIIKKNREYIKKVQTIVLPISNNTFFIEGLGEKEKRLYYHFYKLKEYDQGIYNNLLVLHEPFRELIENAILRTANTSRLGWRANKGVYKFDKSITENRVGDIVEKLTRTATIKKNRNYLKEIINFCNNNQIHLVLLLPPYHPDFYKYSNNRYDKEVKRILKKIDLKSSVLIDGRALKIIDDVCFENIDHLNRKGASLLSKKIDSIINLAGIKKT